MILYVNGEWRIVSLQLKEALLTIHPVTFPFSLPALPVQCHPAHNLDILLK